MADASPVVGSWGLEWKAIASTKTVDARDNIDAGPNDEVVPVYRLDGNPFAAPGETMFLFQGDGLHVDSVPFTELGTMPDADEEQFIAGAKVWTGTDGFGQGHPTFGFLGGDADGFAEGFAAFGDSLDGQMFVYFSGSQPVSREAHFYGISNAITVVPEPPSFVLLLSCLFLFHILTGRLDEIH